jgi:hypothetical protein
MTSWRAEDMITNRFEPGRKIGGESFSYRSGWLVGWLILVSYLQSCRLYELS